MAVQKSKKARSRRNMRRSHDGLKGACLSLNAMTGEVHRRHHIDDAGFYRDQQVTAPKWELDEDE